MRTGALAAAAVLISSVAGRLLLSQFSLYLEPWDVLRRGHVWQLLTWIPAGATPTFVVHALLLALAFAGGATAKRWLGLGFLAGVLSTAMALAIPAVLSCTFAGAGVGAAAALTGFGADLTGSRRRAAQVLPVLPAIVDAAVDGRYTLLPYAFVFGLAALWAFWRRRSYSRAR